MLMYILALRSYNLSLGLFLYEQTNCIDWICLVDALRSSLVQYTNTIN